MLVITKTGSEREVAEALAFTQYAVTTDPDCYGLVRLKGLIVLLFLCKSEPPCGNPLLTFPRLSCEGGRKH